MKNVKNEWLKKAIAIKSYKFTDLVKTICGENVEIEYSLDGLWVGYEDGEVDIEDRLAEYFGVRVLEIHLNNDGPWSEVWISYEEID